jgi:RHS repeat-associated protein
VSESVPQQLRYDGYWWDTEAGWYWLRIRAYDPVLKRFLQPDPSGQDGQFSYPYAGDDPVDASDPTGLAAEVIWSELPIDGGFNSYFSQDGGATWTFSGHEYTDMVFADARSGTYPGGVAATVSDGQVNVFVDLDQQLTEFKPDVISKMSAAAVTAQLHYDENADPKLPIYIWAAATYNADSTYAGHRGGGPYEGGLGDGVIENALSAGWSTADSFNGTTRLTYAHYEYAPGQYGPWYGVQGAGSQLGISPSLVTPTQAANFNYGLQHPDDVQTPHANGTVCDVANAGATAAGWKFLGPLGGLLVGSALYLIC